jgi:hypothetical protein
VISAPEIPPSTVTATRLDGIGRRTLGELPGRVMRLFAGPDGYAHAMLDRDGSFEAWRIPLTGGNATREEPWVMVAPAPQGNHALWFRRPKSGTEYEAILGAFDAPPAFDAPAVASVTPSFAFGFDSLGRTAILLGGDGSEKVMTLDLDSGTSTPIESGADIYGVTLSPDGATIYTSEIDAHVRRVLITNFGERSRP